MTKIKQGDVVQVLPGCVFQSLVYSTGTVVQSLAAGMAIVRFQQKKHCTYAEPLETFNCTDWLIPFSKLKVLDSPHDDRIGTLEEEILGLEADLVTVRSCLAVSEEMRDHQFSLIEKLLKEIDVLKAELYHLKSNSN